MELRINKEDLKFYGSLLIGVLVAILVVLIYILYTTNRSYIAIQEVRNQFIISSQE